MKKVKRNFALLLTVIMILGLLSGCKKEDDEKNDGPRKLTVGIPQSSTIPNYDTNAFCVYLEEKTGIDIEWVYFANGATNYQKQLTLMCTGGELLPDVLLGFHGLGHYIVNQFGEDGYIQDLTDLIESHGKNFKAAMKNLDEDYQDYIWEKGKNTNTGAFYAMPMAHTVFVDNIQSIVHINKSWLDKVGKSVPTTVQELDDVLKAWKAYGDLNGNGEDDEILILGDEKFQSFLINAFVEYNAANWNVKNGQLWDPLYTKEYREALKFANKLTRLGYIDKLSYSVASVSEAKQLITPAGGPTKVGIWTGHYLTMTNPIGEHLKDFVSFPALKSATEKGGYTIYNKYSVNWSAMITKDCKNPELAMELLDVFYLDETAACQRRGEKDVDWKYEEGTDAHGSKTFVRVLNPQSGVDGSLNKTTANWLGIFTHWNYSEVQVQDPNYSVHTIEGQRIYREDWEAFQAGKHQEEPIGDLIYTTEEYDIREAKAGTLSSYISEQAILFMSDELDPNNDTQWKQYMDDLKKYGRDELMKIAQAAYTRGQEKK